MPRAFTSVCWTISAPARTSCSSSWPRRPSADPTYSANARIFNQWLTTDWLKNYPYHNVAVFDFYNTLTTNGGNPNLNDLGKATGNHHRLLTGVIQHKTDGDNDPNPNVLEYPSGDDHPSRAGNLKAVAELLPWLNVQYHCWQGTGGCSTASPSATTARAISATQIVLSAIRFIFTVHFSIYVLLFVDCAQGHERLISTSLPMPSRTASARPDGVDRDVPGVAGPRRKQAAEHGWTHRGAQRSPTRTRATAHSRGSPLYYGMVWISAVVAERLAMRSVEGQPNITFWSKG
ncbi:MAG: hypothetical protein V9E96_03135 [Chitinophagaceae bacterium]